MDELRPGSSGGTARLPAMRLDADGRRRVDMRAVLALALPLVLNSTIQAVLSLTDTWFIGRLSVDATAALGAVYWFVILALLLFGGATMAVQTLVAQAYGGRRYRRASKALWIGLWASVATVPLFVAGIFAGPSIVGVFGLDPVIEGHAVEYWQPRLAGGPFAAALWALSAYFNGIGHTRLPLLVTTVVALANVALNEWLIFGLGLGVTGAALATTLAQVIGVALAMVLMLRLEPARYRPLATWRPQLRAIGRQLALGLPMAATASADLFASALFQVMQVRIGAVDGAATMIVMMFTSLAYMPGIGVALAGTTLVGQAIGAGDRDWANVLGTRIIRLVSLGMGGLGIVMALAGSLLVPLFVNAADANAEATIALALKLLWIAALYQFFDGLNFASSFCLRGAGDVRVPALLVMSLGFGLFIPLCYFLTFAPGQGWFGGPGAGLGAVGGWSALLVYCMCAGAALVLRWRQGAWRAIRLR
jgi:multidrug resistance protein, MATE family